MTDRFVRPFVPTNNEWRVRLALEPSSALSRRHRAWWRATDVHRVAVTTQQRSQHPRRALVGVFQDSRLQRCRPELRPDALLDHVAILPGRRR